jgi:signal transduction histidine kinase
MNFDYIFNIQTCSDFIRDVAPMSLVYYSHYTSIITSLLIGTLVLYYGKKSLTSILLFALSIFFTLWVVCDLVTWASFNSADYMFFWSLLSMLTALIYLTCIYFAYVFVNQRSLPFKFLALFTVLFIPVIYFTPTIYNLSGFSYVDCISLEVPLFTNFCYFFGVFAFIFILILSIVGCIRTADKSFRKQIILMTFGIELFILIFFTATFLDTYFVNAGLTGDYMLSNYGLFGMIIFMAVLAFLIVRFKAFNIKLLGAQALMWTIALLVGSQLFFIKTITNYVLTSITLIISIVAGYILVRSVKSVDEQRSRLEILTDKLEKANQHLRELDQLKSEFVSMATHQIRSPISAIRGYASMLLEGDFGQLTPSTVEPIETVNKSAYSLGLVVEDFLNISRMEQGRMKYDMTKFDMKGLVEEIMRESQPNMKPGVPVTFECIDCDRSDHSVYADKGKIKQVIGNLLDNSIKYTPTGWIKVKLERTFNENKEKVLKVSISDSGVGISTETMPLLFSKFSRAKDANRTNIRGTGLGLYVAKQIVMGHPGADIWAESPGEGKGSTFIIELPVK